LTFDGVPSSSIPTASLMSFQVRGRMKSPMAADRIGSA
jgi:hypothetical protein